MKKQKQKLLMILLILVIGVAVVLAGFFSLGGEYFSGMTTTNGYATNLVDCISQGKDLSTCASSEGLSKYSINRLGEAQKHCSDVNVFKDPRDPSNELVLLDCLDKIAASYPVYMDKGYRSKMTLCIHDYTSFESCLKQGAYSAAMNEKIKDLYYDCKSSVGGPEIMNLNCFDAGFARISDETETKSAAAETDDTLSINTPDLDIGIGTPISGLTTTGLGSTVPVQCNSTTLGSLSGNALCLETESLLYEWVACDAGYYADWNAGYAPTGYGYACVHNDSTNSYSWSACSVNDQFSTISSAYSSSVDYWLCKNNNWTVCDAGNEGVRSTDNRRVCKSGMWKTCSTDLETADANKVVCESPFWNKCDSSKVGDRDDSRWFVCTGSKWQECGQGAEGSTLYLGGTGYNCYLGQWLAPGESYIPGETAPEPEPTPEPEPEAPVLTEPAYPCTSNLTATVVEEYQTLCMEIESYAWDWVKCDAGYYESWELGYSPAAHGYACVKNVINNTYIWTQCSQAIDGDFSTVQSNDPTESDSWLCKNNSWVRCSSYSEGTLNTDENRVCVDDVWRLCSSTSDSEIVVNDDFICSTGAWRECNNEHVGELRANDYAICNGSQWVECDQGAEYSTYNVGGTNYQCLYGEWSSTSGGTTSPGIY